MASLALFPLGSLAQREATCHVVTTLKQPPARTARSSPKPHPGLRVGVSEKGKPPKCGERTPIAGPGEEGKKPSLPYQAVELRGEDVLQEALWSSFESIPCRVQQPLFPRRVWTLRLSGSIEAIGGPCYLGLNTRRCPDGQGWVQCGQRHL